MQVPQPASRGNLFVKGCDLQKQTAGLRCLRHMETKPVSVLSVHRTAVFQKQAGPSDHTGQCLRRIAGGNVGLPLDTM